MNVRIPLALAAALLAGACSPVAPVAPVAPGTDVAAPSASPIAAESAHPTPSAITPPAAGDPCPGVAPTQLAAGFQSRFPARTAAEVIAVATTDPYLRVNFEDLAGVRPGPMRDPRVPQCRLDLLRLGEPIFVRQYPASLGRWLLPIAYDGQTLLTVFISVEGNGIGAIGGSRGGAVPIGAESTARRAGEAPGDPVVSGELVFAKPPGCAPRDTISWRLVRRSGVAVYLVPEYPGAQPPGALFREDEMKLMGASGGRAPYSLAQVRAAC